MADVASILGVEKRGGATGNLLGASTTAAPVTVGANTKAAQKLQKGSREVMGLMTGIMAPDPHTTASLPPAVPGVVRSKVHAQPHEPGAIQIGTRWIKMQEPARKWTWAPFSSSSRTDGALFHHWVRAGVEYPDYPYARFDIHLDPVTYAAHEYQHYIQPAASSAQQQSSSPSKSSSSPEEWTKSETDALMELARRFELRWPVIHDRWSELHPDRPRKTEDLQFRFYHVAAIIHQVRIAQEAASEAQLLTTATINTDSSAEETRAATDHLLYETAAARQLATLPPSQQPLIPHLGTGTSNKVFDIHYERSRRAFLEAQWNRTKEEEETETALRRELKQVEAQLRKLKKSGAHIVAARTLAATNNLTGGMTAGGAAEGAATTVLSATNSAASSRNPSRSVTPVPPSAAGGTGANASSAALDMAFASTVPIPLPGTPYLQSARLAPPAVGGAAGLNKTLLQRLHVVLHQELQVSPRPLPTQRTCDLYDAVRKDAIALLVLQKNVLQKEGLLQSKRVRIDKLLGKPASATATSEESVMGIAPPPPPKSAASNSSTTVAGKAGNKKSKDGGKGPGSSNNKDGGSKSTTKGKQAGKAAGGKQAASKAAAGGKQAKKPAATKRKRKDKSPVPPEGAANPAATTSSAATSTKSAGKKRKKAPAAKGGGKAAKTAAAQAKDTTKDPPSSTT